MKFGHRHSYLQPDTPANPIPPSQRQPSGDERLFVAYLLGFEDGAHGKEPTLARVLVRDGLEQSVWREGFTKGRAARELAKKDASALSGHKEA